MPTTTLVERANPAFSETAPRDRLRVWSCWLAAFVAISSIAGGLEMLVWSRGNAYVPLTLLEGTPFETFLVPGLLLGGVVGGSSLWSAIATARVSGWAMDATLFAGGTLTAWIGCEVALLQEFSWLQVLYGGLGLSLVALALVSIRRRGTLRQRWVALVTAAESLGYLAPALTGILSTHWSTERQPIGWLMVAAGCAEGALLGYGQTLVLPWKVSKWRYVGLTSLAAGGVWAGVFTLMSSLAAPGLLSGTRWLMVSLGGAAMLFAIGGAQWLLLRRLVPNAQAWVGWTGLAWALALPLSFLPGPLVDEATPLLVHVVMWSTGGVLMAYVMAWVTWFGVDSLQRQR